MREIIPVGNVLRYFYAQPEYLRRRFLSEAQALARGGEDWREMQAKAWHLVDAIQAWYCGEAAPTPPNK